MGIELTQFFSRSDDSKLDFNKLLKNAIFQRSDLKDHKT